MHKRKNAFVRTTKTAVYLQNVFHKIAYNISPLHTSLKTKVFELQLFKNVTCSCGRLPQVFERADQNVCLRCFANS